MLPRMLQKGTRCEPYFSALRYLRSFHMCREHRDSFLATSFWSVYLVPSACKIWLSIPVRRGFSSEFTIDSPGKPTHHIQSHVTGFSLSFVNRYVSCAAQNWQAATGNPLPSKGNKSFNRAPRALLKPKSSDMYRVQSNETSEIRPSGPSVFRSIRSDTRLISAIY